MTGALAEVVAAALAGSFFAGWLVFFAGWNPSVDLLSNRNALVFFLLTEASFTLLLVWFLLGMRGRRLASLSPGARSPAREVMTGLLVLPGLFVLVIATAFLFQVLAPSWVSTFNPMLELIQTPADLAWFLLTGILVGGVKEEIQRAFILDRFSSDLGGAWVGLIIWSTLFGAGHLSQGPDRAVQAGLLGFVFGCLYLRRRSVAAPIVSHAAYDVVVVLMVYFFPEV